MKNIQLWQLLANSLCHFDKQNLVVTVIKCALKVVDREFLRIYSAIGMDKTQTPQFLTDAFNIGMFERQNNWEIRPDFVIKLTHDLLLCLDDHLQNSCFLFRLFNTIWLINIRRKKMVLNRTSLMSDAVWPDWAIYLTLGNFLKPLATINLPKSLTFLGNICKGVKIYYFSSEIIFVQL